MTWNIISEGSPLGSTTMKDEAGVSQTVPLNRANRRRLAVLLSTRLERLVEQEERRERIRRVTHAEAPKDVLRRRAARERKRDAYLKRRDEILAAREVGS